MLGVGRSTVYRLIEEGALPSVRLGGIVRIPLSAIRRIASGASVESSGDDAA